MKNSKKLSLLLLSVSFTRAYKENLDLVPIDKLKITENTPLTTGPI